MEKLLAIFIGNFSFKVISDEFVHQFSSAYCGCLWLASLRAAATLAREIGDIKSANLYAKLLLKARDVFEEKLWNGEYYNFDERSESAKTIMADQLCGNWFLMSVSPEIAHDVGEQFLTIGCYSWLF